MTQIEKEIPSHWRKDVSLASFTSWRIGGPALYFAEPPDPSSLASDLRAGFDLQLPVFFIGGGSNILISDRGFPGLVVRYRDRSIRLHVEEDGRSARLRAGANAALAGTARAMAYRGWAGLEWAEGIPGTIGGAIVGNAGAFGGDISQVLLRLEILEKASKIIQWDPDRLSYGYRTSALKENPSGDVLVLTGEFLLQSENPTELRRRMVHFSHKRRRSTPAKASCGSVFKNPPGEAAGRLIESSGLKGKICGNMMVSDIHANYIVNQGDGKAVEALSLIRQVRDTVFEKTGIVLRPEIRFIGFEEDDIGDILSVV
ncbi:MAG: UDP-N-acetylmuramate dehydrogenase [Candidatus Eisenbacteria bacterium]|nr:UDP-N-acetylmuramate dehydrogenase [Candidatus Eisenbacteria bacterium]